MFTLFMKFSSYKMNTEQKEKMCMHCVTDPDQSDPVVTERCIA